MPTGPFELYDNTLLALGGSVLPPLIGTSLTAVLLKPTHVPDLAVHTTYADLMADEVAGQDYRQLRLTGATVTAANGAVAFSSDPLNWGDPVSLPPVGYLALVFGLPGALKPASKLLGIQALNPGGAVEAVRGAFSVSPGVGGWFRLMRT